MPEVWFLLSLTGILFYLLNYWHSDVQARGAKSYDQSHDQNYWECERKMRRFSKHFRCNIENWTGVTHTCRTSGNDGSRSPDSNFDERKMHIEYYFPCVMYLFTWNRRKVWHKLLLFTSFPIVTSSPLPLVCHDTCHNIKPDPQGIFLILKRCWIRF